ncbi:ATP-binding cassette domain-containing protein [Bifidobacterium mongoliense]|jgi:putative ABC transport system ATP-binding protein|uniref:ATP-binding cassette domain-containing protein n=1 Tax=Bifidobacterium mongoliense TaxID=518643 RepID=UPI0030EDE74C
MITLTDLSKSFADHTIWSHVSKSFDAGHLHAITGPSGSGKTTLLNCIGLLEQPTSGSIDLDGRPLTGIRPSACQRYRRTRLGYLFQNYALIENAAVSFNLRIALGPGHLTKSKRRAIANALGAVGLTGYERRPIYQLSGGEQQRVALARLIVKKADIILADEPTGALDDMNSSMVIDTLKDMATHGATVLIATHDHTVLDACDTRLDLGHL